MQFLSGSALLVCCTLRPELIPFSLDSAVSGISGGITANELGQMLHKFLGQKDYILRNEHLTGAVGKAIAAVIMEEALYQQKALRHLADTAIAKWPELAKATVNSPKFSKIQETQLPNIFATPPSQFGKDRVLELTTWKELLYWLSDAGEITLTENCITYKWDRETGQLTPETESEFLTNHSEFLYVPYGIGFSLELTTLDEIATRLDAIFHHKLQEAVKADDMAFRGLELLMQGEMMYRLRSMEVEIRNLSQSEKCDRSPQQDAAQTAPFPEQLVFDSLLKIDFKEQFRLARTVMQCPHPFAAFLIHGQPAHGQQALLKRLFNLSPNAANAQKIYRDLSSYCGQNIERLWRELAQKLQLAPDSNPQEIASKVWEEWLPTQDVIFMFDRVDDLESDSLCYLLDRFWQTFVTVAPKNIEIQPDSPRLLMFMVDNKGQICNSIDLAEHFPHPQFPQLPLRLPPTCAFPADELEDWVDRAFEDKVLFKRLDIQELLAATNNGIPQYVYEEICYHLGYTWNGGLEVKCYS
jgi:hypothetical protein